MDIKMDSPDILTQDTQVESTEARNVSDAAKSSDEECGDLQQQVIANFQKPNLPNVNVPERIIICLDICHDKPNSTSLFRLGDGSTFTPVNMLKRILDFFLHSKHAINKRTEFALLVLKDTEACWVQNFTSNMKDIISVLDYLNPEETLAETFDFNKVFQILKQKVEIPEHKQKDLMVPPPYVVRMIVLYGRSDCLPLIPLQDPYFNFIKKQLYFYIDILMAHEHDCDLYKCEDIFDALQDLDNGYSYVFEVSKNATKIHECCAKLLAHPLQRPLQKHADYAFGSRY